MSVVANISFVNNYNSLFLLKATVVNTSTLTADEISTNQLIANEAVINTLAAGNITTSNITNSDTLTTYFENSQYTTVEQVLNVTGVANIPELGGSNAIFTSIATQAGFISSMTTNNINLDGNVLDTAGAGIGAVLLLNGYPVATTSTSISSVANWSVFPAISTVYMDSNDIVQAANIQTATLNSDNIFTYDLQATNQIVFGTNLFGGNATLSNVSAIKVQANLVSTLNLETNSATIKTLVNSNVTTDTINATNITAANYQTTALGSYNGTTGNFTTGNIPNLNVTSSANFSGARPNFTTGINSSGANNFNNQSLDNCPNINTQGTTNMTIACANAMDLTAPTRIQLICDGGNDFGSVKPVNIIGRNGNRGQVNITAQPGYVNIGTQIQGEVNIVANGGGGLTAYATGGLINITANTGSSPVLGTLTYSAIKLNAAGITSYAGFASPLIAVPGYNLIQGSLGIELIAGSVPVLPNVPGTIYLYGATGIPQQTGGIRAQNGLGIDFIVPYPQGFNTQPYDLIISGNPAGQKVTLSNVRILQSDGGTASGFTSMTTSNFQASNIIVTRGAPGQGIILGLTGQEVLTNFSNVSTLGIQTGLVYADNISSLNASILSFNNVSTINGFTIDQLVSTVTPAQFYSTTSTFQQLFTSSLQATNISSITANITQISGLSTLNGYTVEQLISSVSPLVFFSTVSSFQQLATSSLSVSSIIGTASNLNFQVAGQLLVNGVPAAQALQLSTTQQFFTSSLAADNISSAALQVSTINGFNFSEIVNQPLVSSFNLLSASSIGALDFFASTGTIDVASNVVLNVSSINGFNTGQFLALTNVSTVSSFNNLFANNISAGQVVAQTLSSQIVNASSINGYNVSQFVAVPLISTVSTFQQLFTSSIQAVNISSITANIYALNGASSINGFSIAELVSSVSPPTPAPSTFNQLFTSSLVANTVRGSNFDLDVTAQSIVTISGGQRLNLNADTCNIAITAPNIQTLTSFNNTVGVGNDYALTATNNISMNASNTAILYTTNTAPTPPSQGIVILGQGNSIFASQIDTTVSAVGTLNLNGASVLVNGAPINTTVTSTFNQLYAYQLSNNPTIGSGALGILASSEIDMAAPTIQVNASDYLLGASNSFTQSSNTRLQGSNSIAIYNGALPAVAAGSINVEATNYLNLLATDVNISTNTINLNAPSTICLGDIRAVTFNGLPLPTSGGGGSGSVTSTFSTVFTNILSNNPAISNDLKIRAANAVVLNDTGATSISLGGILDVQGGAGGTNIETNYFNSLNSLIAFTAYNTLDLLSLSSLTVTGQSSINITSSNINLFTPSTICSGDIRATTFNGLPLPTSGGGGSGSVTSTFSTVFTNILSNNPAIGNDLFIRASNSIQLGDTGATGISLGGIFQVSGGAGGTLIETNYFNSLNSLISFSAYNTFDLLSISSLTVTGQSSINVTSSNITLDAPKVKLDVDDVNIYSFGSQSFRFVKEDPYNYLQTVSRPMIITGLGGADTAFVFDGTGSNKSFRTLDMCNNDINNVSTIKAPSGATLRLQNNGGSGFFQLENAGNIYMVANNGATNGGMDSGLIFWAGQNITSKVFGATSAHTFEVYDGSAVLQNSVIINSNGLNMCNAAINNLSSITSAVATMTLSNTSNIAINAPTINVGGAVNANCNAISNVGDFSRYLISTELPQPVIQYAYVSTAGATSGTVTITLPQRYTTVDSYIPFAVVQNDTATTFYVSTVTRATFEIGWDGYLGIGDIIFSWNTLGT